MRVFLNAVLVHTFLNLYVFWRGWQIIPPKLAYRIPFIALFIIELVVYFIGFVYIDELPLDILHQTMITGTSWMVFILYMTVFLVIYDFMKLLDRKIKVMPGRINLVSLKLRRTYYSLSCIVVVLIMIYGSYRFWNPVVTEFDVTVEKESPVKDLKIAMVADVHAGYLVNRKVLNMYVDKIMEQNPDIILLVGDIIDYNMNPIEEERMEEEFRRLKAPYGVYASTGNHEYRLNAEEKIKWLSRSAGFTVLRDSAVLVSDAFYVVGREDDKAPKRKALSEIMEGVNKNLPVIVMNHEPRRLSEESEAGADLALYGHTHNGQLFPYNILMRLAYEVSYGYKKKNNTNIYVTSGLGLSGPQYRIGTFSEIVVINMKTQ